MKESNAPKRTTYESVVFELEIPKSGQAVNPAINKVLVGTNYSSYTGFLDINAYVDRQLVDQNLPDILPKNNKELNCDAEILEYYGSCETVEVTSYTEEEKVGERPWWDRRPDPIER